MTIQRILIVDDDPLSREFLTEAIRELGYTPRNASSAEQALEMVAAEIPELVITDLRMPGMSGLELVECLHGNHPELPTVLITAHGTVECAVTAMRDGATDFLIKPCTPEALQMVIERIDRTLRLQHENAYLREEMIGTTAPTMIAESQSILDLLRSAARIARSKGTVLLTGESGTGKERVANYIHQSSNRADKPFVRVNCAALSEQLLESELFGHERGAFTGAHKLRIGRFELADGGTILLDEIGEISPAMQAKLLRVLQEEEFERVGGQRTLKVDVRIIASTNRDLSSEVSIGRFREDLYYRLHVLPLHLPPLRERIEDIIPLSEHFSIQHARNNGIPTPSITEESKRRLREWHWPGNVRELENVIQRAVILSAEGGPIGPAELVFGPGRSAADLRQETHTALNLEHPDIAVAIANKPMADVERVAILATLRSAKGNKTEAARRLGLTARTLSNKMKIWRQAGLVA